VAIGLSAATAFLLLAAWSRPRGFDSWPAEQQALLVDYYLLTAALALPVQNSFSAGHAHAYFRLWGIATILLHAALAAQRWPPTWLSLNAPGRWWLLAFALMLGNAASMLVSRQRTPDVPLPGGGGGWMPFLVAAQCAAVALALNVDRDSTPWRARLALLATALLSVPFLLIDGGSLLVWWLQLVCFLGHRRGWLNGRFVLAAAAILWMVYFSPLDRLLIGLARWPWPADLSHRLEVVSGRLADVRGTQPNEQLLRARLVRQDARPFGHVGAAYGWLLGRETVATDFVLAGLTLQWGYLGLAALLWTVGRTQFHGFRCAARETDALAQRVKEMLVLGWLVQWAYPLLGWLFLPFTGIPFAGLARSGTWSVLLALGLAFVIRKANHEDSTEPPSPPAPPSGGTFGSISGHTAQAPPQAASGGGRRASSNPSARLPRSTFLGRRVGEPRVVRRSDRAGPPAGIPARSGRVRRLPQPAAAPAPRPHPRPPRPIVGPNAPGGRRGQAGLS